MQYLEDVAALHVQASNKNSKIVKTRRNMTSQKEINTAPVMDPE